MMPSEAEVTHTKALRPFWGRVLIADSPADEEQRESGLVVPLHHDGQKDEFRRGVVVHIDQTYHDLTSWGDYARQIDSGTPVFFRRGVKIGIDTWVVDIDDILAFEADS